MCGEYPTSYRWAPDFWGKATWHPSQELLPPPLPPSPSYPPPPKKKSRSPNKKITGKELFKKNFLNNS
jgi:hypothetical protein